MSMIAYSSKNLKPGDRVKKEYSGKLGDKNAYLLLTNEKILIVIETGLIKRKHKIALNTPYSEINEVKQENDNQITLYRKNGVTQALTINNVPAQAVINSINNERIKNQ